MVSSQGLKVVFVIFLLSGCNMSGQRAKVFETFSNPNIVQDNLQSGPSNPSGDTTKPTVSITSPTAGSTLTGTFSVTATASDNVAVVGVQFKLDGADLGSEDTVFPYSASLNTTLLTNANHTLSALARDFSGNTQMSTSVTVMVNNVTPAPPDTTQPAVAISSPASGSTVSGTITVTATASDNIGVAGVQFRLNGANLGAEDMSSPYSTSLNTTTLTNGTHMLTAFARDAAGNTRLSASVSITVNNVTAPTKKLVYFPKGMCESSLLKIEMNGSSYSPFPQISVNQCFWADQAVIPNLKARCTPDGSSITAGKGDSDPVGPPVSDSTINSGVCASILNTM